MITEMNDTELHSLMRDANHAAGTLLLKEAGWSHAESDACYWFFIKLARKAVPRFMAHRQGCVGDKEPDDIGSEMFLKVVSGSNDRAMYFLRLIALSACDEYAPEAERHAARKYFRRAIYSAA